MFDNKPEVKISRFVGGDFTLRLRQPGHSQEWRLESIKVELTIKGESFYGERDVPLQDLIAAWLEKGGFVEPFRAQSEEG